MTRTGRHWIVSGELAAPQVGAVRAHGISEPDVARLREQIGVESPIPQFNFVATPDAIRHFCHGYGDDNPLWLDPERGRASVWGANLAPPTFVLTCGFARSRGLPGVHGLFGGVDLISHQAIRAGDEIHAMTSLHSLEEREGRYAGKQFVQTYRTKYHNQHREQVATLYSYAFRTQRSEGRSRQKYAQLQRHRYTSEQIAEIASHYETEATNRRLAQERTFDAVRVGEELPTMVKGPLTVTDMIGFLMGFGPIFVRPHRLGYEFAKRHPGAAVPDEYGVPDAPERVHWDPELAAAIGMPAPYDYGPQRVAWFGHLVTDWMGDAGWLCRLIIRLLEPNFVGDTTWLRGSVTGKDEATKAVRLSLAAIDQRGRRTADGTAEVLLPSRDGIPADILATVAQQ